MCEVPLGKYQVVVRAGIGPGFEYPTYGDGAVDLVRVAPDSVAQVDVPMINSLTEEVKMARIWQPRYAPIEGPCR